MDILTLAFDITAVLGGFYLLVGLVLHLVEAWQTYETTADLVQAPAMVNQRQPSELERLLAWNQRFGLGYGGEGV